MVNRGLLAGVDVMEMGGIQHLKILHSILQGMRFIWKTISVKMEKIESSYSEIIAYSAA